MDELTHENLVLEPQLKDIVEQGERDKKDMNDIIKECYLLDVASRKLQIQANSAAIKYYLFKQQQFLKQSKKFIALKINKTSLY